MMDARQRRRTGVRTHTRARAELKMQNRGASSAHRGTTEAYRHTNYCNAHTNVYLDESANRMSEVQPAEFIYYKYTQTHARTLLCVLSGTCDPDTSVPKRKERVDTIRVKGEERCRGVSVKGKLAPP